MIAAPWYLLSVGIVLVILGSIAGAVFGPGRSGPGIDPKMSDAEIARRLKRRSSPSASGLVVLAGILCVVVSLAWRLLLIVL